MTCPSSDLFVLNALLLSSIAANAGIVIGASSVRVLADPLGDDEGCTAAGYERDSISTVMCTLASTREGPGVEPLGARWSSIVGGELLLNGMKGARITAPSLPLTLSVEDWVTASAPPSSSLPSFSTKAGSAASPKGDLSSVFSTAAVLVHCPGRLSSVLSPRDVVSLSLHNLGLLFVADMGLNDTSYRRQNSLDNLKRSEEICMEDPLALAAVLSLSGVGSLIVHR